MIRQRKRSAAESADSGPLRKSLRIASYKKPNRTKGRKRSVPDAVCGLRRSLRIASHKKSIRRKVSHQKNTSGPYSAEYGNLRKASYKKPNGTKGTKRSAPDAVSGLRRSQRIASYKKPNRTKGRKRSVPDAVCGLRRSLRIAQDATKIRMIKEMTKASKTPKVTSAEDKKLLKKVPREAEETCSVEISKNEPQRRITAEFIDSTTLEEPSCSKSREAIKTQDCHSREVEESLSSVELSQSKPQRRITAEFIDSTALEEPSCSKTREAIRTQGSDCHTRQVEGTLSSVELSNSEHQHRITAEFIDSRALEEPSCSKTREAIKTQGSDCHTRELEGTLSSVELSNSEPQQRITVEFIDLTILEEPSSSKSREAIKTQGSDCHTSKNDEKSEMEECDSNSLEEISNARDVYPEDSKKSTKEQSELEQTRMEQLKTDHSAMKNKTVHPETTESVTRDLNASEILHTVELKPAWPQLTPEEQREIDAALFLEPADEVLVKAFNLRISRKDLRKLESSSWLNDEIINFYMNLLIERGKHENYPKVYAFNTFFYIKLSASGHEALKRMTRQIDIFAFKMVFIPVHMDKHWCLAVINFDTKTIKYYNSMGTPNQKCLMDLLTYLKAERMDKKKEEFDVSVWKLENVKDIPHQMNTIDCGVFVCMYAEFIAREAKLTFTQVDMPYFRRKMVFEILKRRLL